MLAIEDEYLRVKKISKKKGQTFLGSSTHKDDREIFILGAFSELLSQGKQIVPKYFEKVKPPEPDFHIFTSDKNFYKHIEIVENLHWGRKRGIEHRLPLDRNKYLDDSNRCNIRVWYNFIKNINQKFTKHYGKNSWLVIYHNINIYHISSVGFWINIIFNMKDEFVRRRLINFSNSTYEKIFVINAGLTELLTIYPEDKIIFSEYAKYSIKK
ncbi:MAG: hypothetical protein R6W90_13100 [Ignavibacteriaceae bacterium]